MTEAKTQNAMLFILLFDKKRYTSPNTINNNELAAKLTDKMQAFLEIIPSLDCSFKN